MSRFLSPDLTENRLARVLPEKRRDAKKQHEAVATPSDGKLPTNRSHYQLSKRGERATWPSRGFGTPLIRSVFRGALVSSALLRNTAKSPDRIRSRAPVAKRRLSATRGSVFRSGNTRRRLNNGIEF